MRIARASEARVHPRTIKPYAAYKDSGVEWLGKIPAHWKAKRLKFVAAEPIKNGIGEAGAYDDPEWPRYIRITDIAGPRELRQDTFKSLPPELAKLALFKVGDLLLAAVGATFGKSYLHARDLGQVCFAGYIVRFSPGHEVESGFAAYWTESSAYWALVQSRVVQATIQNFSAAKYQELVLPLPSVPEQRAIAAFLDRETARIDALVAKKERLIELLQEERTALFTRAVTKGLDPNASMKDSGVEWLGEIPTHWKVKKWRYCCHVTEGQVAPDDDGFRDRILIAPNHVESGTGRILYTETADEQGAISGKYLVKPEDLIYSKIRPALNKVCIAGGDWLCSADMYPVAITDEDLESRFLLYFMLSDPFVRLMVDESMRVAMPKVNRDKLSACPLLVPDPEEQGTIVAFLDRETARIDALAAKVGEAIERLKELRTALISAAVTGKIDVREEAA